METNWTDENHHIAIHEIIEFVNKIQYTDSPEWEKVVQSLKFHGQKIIKMEIDNQGLMDKRAIDDTFLEIRNKIRNLENEVNRVDSINTSRNYLAHETHSNLDKRITAIATTTDSVSKRVSYVEKYNLPVYIRNLFKKKK